MDEIGDPVIGVTQNDSESRPNLNISDVFEAISIADPSFGAVDEMYRPPANAPAPAPALDRPYVRIVEQPASKSLRFRYECEGRSAGSIPGVNSTPERKTFPTIEVCGYKGRFVVLVSCVTKDKPYRPHPHNLVGREPMCSRGVCTVELADTPVVQFSNLGIQCVKRKDIAEALRVREAMKVDPFKTGFAHKSQPQTIDLNAVRLCFQVYIPGSNTAKIKQALPPVVSDVIYDKKAMCELQINRISSCAGSARGGTELILLCEKVTREDIEVVFSQRLEGGAWESCANILLVHKQVAIAFQAPPYRDPACQEHVKVQICLRRVSDKACSAPVDFEYTPAYADSEYLSKKKRKMTHIDSFLQTAYAQDRGYMEAAIKTEPRDASPALSAHSPARPEHYPQYPEPGERYQQWLGEPAGYWGPHEYSPLHSPAPLQAMSPMQSVSPGHRLSPGVLQPLGGLSPGLMPMQAGSMQPGSMQPGAMQPGSMQPGAMQPGSMQPGAMLQTSPAPQQMLQTSPVPQQMMQSSPAPQMVPMQMQPMEGDGLSGLNSADLSGLIAMLGAPPELTDSMRQLSTGDLVQ